MAHSESSLHHDLIGKMAENFNENVARLLDFVSGRGNPLVIVKPNDSIKPHNFITKQMATTEVSRHLLQIFTEGTKHYDEFKQEWFIERLKKLSRAISRQSLPQLDYIPPCHGGFAEDERASGAAVAAAQHEIEIARQIRTFFPMMFYQTQHCWKEIYQRRQKRADFYQKLRSASLHMI